MTAPLKDAGIPILLNSSCAVASGALNVPDLEPLSSPYRSAMFVDAITIVLQFDNNNESDQALKNFGGNVRVKLALDDKIELMRVPVPVALLGPQLTDNQDYKFEAILGRPSAITSYASSYNHFHWQLPRPLFVKAGASLVPTFSRVVDSITGSVTAYIGYHGRRLPLNYLAPGEIDVPWVGAFLPGVAVSPAPLNFVSNELDLVNPFDVDLNVQRFLGRCYIPSTATDVGSFASAGNMNGTGTVQMWVTSDTSREMIKELTPFFHVFDVNRRAWTTRPWQLPPHSRVTCQLSSLQNNKENMVSMVGWRKEKI